MVAISTLLLASTTLLAVGQAAMVLRATSTDTAAWNSTDTESIMALIGAGYPVSCDSDCGNFAEALGIALGETFSSALNSTDSTSSSDPATALCVSSVYSAITTCGNCIDAAAPTSNISLSLPSYITEFNAECNTTLSLSGSTTSTSSGAKSSSTGSTSPTGSTSTTGAASSVCESIGWAPVMGLAVVAGFASLL